MFIKFIGVMLSEVELPPTAPQPNVNAGARLVVAPTPPSEPPTFTNILDTGFLKANSLMISLFSEWIIRVCPSPSFSSNSIALSQAFSAFSST